ncbi:hypothetical protein Tco_0182284, partial [Tanacetum coccineum]
DDAITMLEKSNGIQICATRTFEKIISLQITNVTDLHSQELVQFDHFQTAPFTDLLLNRPSCVSQDFLTVESVATVFLLDVATDWFTFCLGS